MILKRLKLKIILILLLPLGMFLTFIAAHNHILIEHIYSMGFYRIIGQLLSIITGVIPISLGEILVISAVFSAAAYVIYILFSIIRHPKDFLSVLLNGILNIAAAISITYFVFILIWGLNYQRLSFAEITHMDVRPASVSELSDLCSDLIDRANTLRAGQYEDKAGVMTVKGSVSDVFKRAPLGYKKAAALYPALDGTYGKPKSVLFSVAMSYTGISGIYFPFTGEANVNTAQTDSMLPCTASHEMAHQRGFAREDEANYIAYLTCKLHPDADFQYSGTLLALIYAMNSLNEHDPEKYIQLSEGYSLGVLNDLNAIDNFWKQYEGPVEKVQTRINNTYLKANLQKEGVYSYGRMVDLLLAERRNNTGRH